VLRVFLEAEGELRSKYQWHALFPPAPTVLSSAARFVKQVVGMERAAPSPLDVAQPAASSRDVYRLMREQLAQLTGTLADFSITPEERALRDQAVSGGAAGVFWGGRRRWAGRLGGPLARWWLCCSG
jgi:hypothetical protein